ncbi:hypothetical protein IC575_016360 [Cucumis melo]
MNFCCCALCLSINLQPKNPALLGLNERRGIRVKLKALKAKQGWGFLPFNQVFDTMLHEFFHNLHGPHNANLYEL